MNLGEANNNGRAVLRVLNPLWMISLFLGVSETTVGVAATQATGWIQGVFAVFAVAFPVTVAGAFFAVLWKKPEVLYAPGDFPEHVPVPDFVRGMHRGATGNLESISSVLRDTLESVLPAILAPEITVGSVDKVVGEVVASAQTDLRSRALRIDLGFISADLGSAEWLVDATTTVSDLLDRLYYHVSEHFPPATYGTLWVLVDRRSLKVFDEMGRVWAREFGRDRDDRLLTDVGISSGTELSAVPRSPARTSWLLSSLEAPIVWTQRSHRR
jgi:hypothetical protein